MIAPTARLALRYNPLAARYAAVFSPFQQQVASFTTGFENRRTTQMTSVGGLVPSSTSSSIMPSGSLGAVRNAGTSVLGCAIAVVAVGGCAQGIGQLFAALVVGIARNPSMKEDLFTYTLIGMGFLEFLALGVILISFLLLYSE
jgi:F0F1-type ATP synthase membrane subunit c/vacuolar-type H+-ATPase subunit K